MFVAHFAAGLALRGRAPRLPVAAFIGGAFLLDGLWIAFDVGGLDRSAGADWSHSVVMALIWASVYAAGFARAGSIAMLALWASVASHWLLDLLIQGGNWYPGSPLDQHIPVIVGAHVPLVQRLFAVVLLLVFVRDEARAGALSWRTAATCVLAAALANR